MAIVVDVSAILALALDDENASYAESVVAAIAADEAVVPTLFWFEIRNALLMCEKRKRLTVRGTTSFLADLALLPFVVDDSPRELVVMDFARRFELRVYDATYLELAQRKGLSLATLDAALRSAARLIDVEIFSN